MQNYGLFLNYQVNFFYKYSTSRNNKKCNFYYLCIPKRCEKYRMSIRDVDLNSKEWCDLVFEDRNKEYGAYELRKTSTHRHLVALFSVTVVAVGLFLLLKIINFNSLKNLKDYDYEVKPIELSSLIGLEEANNKQVHATVKAEEKPALKEIVNFTPPTITQDETEIQDLKELQEPNLSSDSTDASSTSKEDSLLLLREMAALNQVDDSTEIMDEKNRDAQFQDGKTALLRYIYQNIHYPPAALKQRINGRVICSFIVNEDGSLSDVTLIQGVYIFLDDEVLRVIRSMPQWKPAMKDGKPVKIKYIMPVVFKLN